MKFKDLLTESYPMLSDDKLKSIDDISTLFKFSYETYEDLMYYIHDDKHLGKSNSLKEAIKFYGEINDKTLYRGCSDKELDSLLKTGKPNSAFALSFSEDKKVAKQFGNNIITVKAKTLKGFCLWKFYSYYYNLVMQWCKLHNEDPENFIPEPDYWIETVLKEKEWIFDRDTEWVCIDEDKLIFADSNTKINKRLDDEIVEKLYTYGIKARIGFGLNVVADPEGTKYNSQENVEKLCKELCKSLSLDFKYDKFYKTDDYYHLYFYDPKKPSDRYCYVQIRVI